LAKSSCGSSPLWLHRKFDPKNEHQEVCNANEKMNIKKFVMLMTLGLGPLIDFGS
jgi:hypothetical protein